MKITSFIIQNLEKLNKRSQMQAHFIYISMIKHDAFSHTQL